MRAATRSFLRWAVALLMLAAVAGCRMEPPPDPNDPADVGKLQPEVLRRQMAYAWEALSDRVAKEEISEEEAKDIIFKHANELLGDVKAEDVTPENAWQYGEIYKTARNWKEAEQILRVAVDHGKERKNADRLVNDTLRLAVVIAEQGRGKEAVELARTVFDVRPQDKAPILPAVFFELVPAAQPHTDAVLLAQLLEEAIDQHNDTVVDPKSNAGRAFLTAKPHHLRNAWDKVIELYRRAGRDSLAEKAAEKKYRMLSTNIRV